MDAILEIILLVVGIAGGVGYLLLRGKRTLGLGRGGSALGRAWEKLTGKGSGAGGGADPDTGLGNGSSVPKPTPIERPDDGAGRTGDVLQDLASTRKKLKDRVDGLRGSGGSGGGGDGDPPPATGP